MPELPQEQEEEVVLFAKEKRPLRHEQPVEQEVLAQEECGDSTLMIHLESKCECPNFT